MRQLTDGLTLSIEPVRGRLGFVRREFGRFLQQRGINDDAWPLIVDELVANAIDAFDAPSGGGSSPVTVSMAIDRSRVQLVVAGAGPAYTLPPPGRGPPPVTAHRGRGLALVAALVDGIEVHHLDGVNVTTCWRLRPPAPVEQAVDEPR